MFFFGGVFLVILIFDELLRASTHRMLNGVYNLTLCRIRVFRLFREFPDLLPDAPLADRAMAMVPATAGRLASLSAEWLRVGFCQGNFNADNCLVGGRTMDYGPFGFMDKYDPAFAKWTGSGNHFAFMNQPAAYGNFDIFLDLFLAHFSHTAPHAPCAMLYFVPNDSSLTGC